MGLRGRQPIQIDRLASTDRLNKYGQPYLGSAELASVLGVSKQVLVNWQKRNHSLPKPVQNLRCSPIWRAGDVRKWLNRDGGQYEYDG